MDSSIPDVKIKESLFLAARIEYKLKLIPALTRDGKIIGRAASNGDKQALYIIDLYTLLYKNFDIMVFDMLKRAAIEYGVEI
jgi:hypothetical protein